MSSRLRLLPHRPTPGHARSSTQRTRSRALMAAAGSFPSPIRRRHLRDHRRPVVGDGDAGRRSPRARHGDVDLVHGVLTVREAKFNKSRELPVHETTVRALRAYAKRRVQLCPDGTTPAFFVSAAGTRVLYCNFHLGFQELVRRAGIEARSPSCRPRPHDLRHSFAVRTADRLVSRRSSTSRPSSRSSRPTWVTSIRPPPTGTCRARQSCSAWRPSAWSATYEARP